MNTFEEVKKIKWIVKQIAESATKNGFTIKCASLYQENDEDPKLWESIKKTSINGALGYFTNLILFKAEIACSEFTFSIVLGEKWSEYCVIDKDEHSSYAKIKNNSQLIGFLAWIYGATGIDFDVHENFKSILSTIYCKLNEVNNDV